MGDNSDSDSIPGPKLGKAVFAELTGAIRQGHRRSALDRWMTENFDEFSRFLEENGTDWRSMTAGFDACGFGEGGPLGPEAARMTWYRVRRRQERRQKRPGYVPVSPVADPSERSQPKPPEKQNERQGVSSLDALAAVKAEMLKRSGR